MWNIVVWLHEDLTRCCGGATGDHATALDLNRGCGGVIGDNIAVAGLVSRITCRPLGCNKSDCR
ncbi:hypothetical protein TIFTF001_037682 [Ficus carica]|uniref:Uncharacterized protein n=1 Tax=Ficus carica TaxID=3494 RepID=A0AA88EA84_FICCA|nr:hypothetical protein TIFTF001_037682 [Ficus carica]